MKTLSCLLPLLLLLLPVRGDDAGNLIQNGDFADGIDHWYGQARSPADFANDNPLQASDPFTSKGMIIPLRAESWVKVAQDFKGKSTNMVLNITYMVSKDFAFSTKPEDYQNMPGKIGYSYWNEFNTPLGTWVAFLSDFGTSMGTYFKLTPKAGSTDPQPLHLQVNGLQPFSSKTLTLAFPPGKGMVVILNVSLVSQ